MLSQSFLRSAFTHLKNAEKPKSAESFLLRQIEKVYKNPNIKIFLKNTFEVISEEKPHKIAAAFTFGREGLIPGMFTSIIENVQQNFQKEDLSLFKYYFDRHIELDGDEHGPMAFKMVEELCGNDEKKWEEVKRTAEEALDARLKLWEGIEEEISENIESKNLQTT